MGALTHRERLDNIPPALLVAIVYPMALVMAVVFESRDDESGATFAVAWILAGGLASTIALLVRVVSARPESSFRRLSIVWFALSIDLLFVMGVGVIFLPLAVSSRLAAGRFVADSAQPDSSNRALP